MSNPQHPQFTGATPLRFELGVTGDAVPADMAGDEAHRPHDADDRAWQLGIGLTGLALWAFLIVELTTKFSPPTLL